MGKGNRKHRSIHLHRQGRVYSIGCGCGRRNQRHILQILICETFVVNCLDRLLALICIPVTHIVGVVDGLVEKTNFVQQSFSSSSQFEAGIDIQDANQTFMEWRRFSFVLSFISGTGILVEIDSKQFFLCYREVPHLGSLVGNCESENWSEIYMYAKPFSWLEYCRYDICGMHAHAFQS